MYKAGAEPSHPLINEEDPTYVPSKGWAEMIRKVYEIDPLLCPKLTFMAERTPPPQRLRQEFLMAAEERGEYF